jgi:hypothetical protein
VMYQIFKKVVDENEYWTLVEEMQDDLVLAQRLLELRQDGNEYVAEKRDGCFSSVLEA